MLRIPDLLKTKAVMKGMNFSLLHRRLGRKKSKNFQ